MRGDEWPQTCGVCGDSPVVKVYDALPGGEALPVCSSCDIVVGSGAQEEGRRGYRTSTGAWITTRNWSPDEDD